MEGSKHLCGSCVALGISSPRAGWGWEDLHDCSGTLGLALQEHQSASGQALAFSQRTLVRDRRRRFLMRTVPQEKKPACGHCLGVPQKQLGVSPEVRETSDNGIPSLLCSESTNSNSFLLEKRPQSLQRPLIRPIQSRSLLPL